MTQLLTKNIYTDQIDYTNENMFLNLDEIRFSNTIKTSFLKLKQEKPKLLPKKNKIKANNLRVSYNNKFLLSRKRILYRRTIIQNYIKHMRRQHAEKVYLDYLEKNMPKIERKERYKRSFNAYYTTFIAMSNRTYDYTRAFVTHRVKNTFVTIFRGKGHRKNNYGMKVLAKVSSGLIGYRGPKKSTVFARKGVIKEAGHILSNKMTSLLDVIFTSHISRWNRKSVRDLCPNLSYVQNIYIKYSRPHGFIKKKNKRRV